VIEKMLKECDSRGELQEICAQSLGSSLPEVLTVSPKARMGCANGLEPSSKLSEWLCDGPFCSCPTYAQ
jgi:hypothetical protein